MIWWISSKYRHQNLDIFNLLSPGKYGFQKSHYKFQVITSYQVGTVSLPDLCRHNVINEKYHKIREYGIMGHTDHFHLIHFEMVLFGNLLAQVIASQYNYFSHCLFHWSLEVARHWPDLLYYNVDKQIRYHWNSLGRQQLVVSISFIFQLLVWALLLKISKRNYINVIQI